MQRIYLSLAVLCLCMLVGDYVCAGEKVHYSKFLHQQHLTDVEALLKRRAEANSAEQRWAKKSLEMGREYYKRGLRSPVYMGACWKSYADSVLCYPTVEGLLGTAVAYARQTGRGDWCMARAWRKIFVQKRAVACFDAAIELHRRLGRKSDASPEMIHRYLHDLFDEQKRVFGRAYKCFEGVKPHGKE